MKKIQQQVMLSIWMAAGIILLSIAANGCKKANATESQPPVVINDSTKRILFVGNSLTYTNDLPAMLTQVARDSGLSIITTTLAFPNYALEDHWNDGKIQILISSGKYDFVVVQQGPSSQADGRAILMDYGARIKSLCVAHNTKLAFFMVWPAYANFSSFDGVIRNYTDAAEATNSILCPVGKLWKEHFAATGNYNFYGPDMFHPSVAGSKNAAAIIFKSLFQ